ncbi:uncharacterized protein [Oryctolagus cuniculus]|uniref:uncharacterized protein isoform X2 n=1 Tax=Oryctolagus cuniculus TaxID=9986 RepID=UPI0038792854
MQVASMPGLCRAGDTATRKSSLPWRLPLGAVNARMVQALSPGKRACVQDGVQETESTLRSHEIPQCLRIFSSPQIQTFRFPIPETLIWSDRFRGTGAWRVVRKTLVKSAARGPRLRLRGERQAQHQTRWQQEEAEATDRVQEVTLLLHRACTAAPAATRGSSARPPRAQGAPHPVPLLCPEPGLLRSHGRVHLSWTCACPWTMRTTRERDGDLPSAGSFPKCLQQLGLGQAEAQTREFTPGLPCGKQGPIYLKVPGHSSSSVKSQSSFFPEWTPAELAPRGEQQGTQVHTASSSPEMWTQRLAVVSTRLIH